MSHPAIIACALHDYMEIACVYGYQVKLQLKNGQSIEGKAVDLFTSPEKREYLLIESLQQRKVELIEIKELQVLTTHANFQKVEF